MVIWSGLVRAGTSDQAQDHSFVKVVFIFIVIGVIGVVHVNKIRLGLPFDRHIGVSGNLVFGGPDIGHFRHTIGVGHMRQLAFMIKSELSQIYNSIRQCYKFNSQKKTSLCVLEKEDLKKIE